MSILTTPLFMFSGLEVSSGCRVEGSFFLILIVAQVSHGQKLLMSGFSGGYIRSPLQGCLAFNTIAPMDLYQRAEDMGLKNYQYHLKYVGGI